MDDPVAARLAFAKSLAREAGALALHYFRALGELVIEEKGAQDHVSNADRDVETFLRTRLRAAFPEDGIVGEEHGRIEGASGFTWVLDPIDGTANFVRGMPAWCVVLACVEDDRTKVGVVFDPCGGELYAAMAGGGAELDGRPIRVAETRGLNDGSTGVGMNGRTDPAMVVRFIDALVGRGGIFFRNASGALMLAYVAAGRLIGYVEPHMNAWDCLAAQLLVAEAGGGVEPQSAEAMIAAGGRVVVGAPPVFGELQEMANRAFAV